MTVLTISREFGAGGRTLGKRVAKELGYTLVDEDIVQMVAERAKVSKKTVKSMEKEAGGSLLRFMNYLISQKQINRILEDHRGYLDEEVYVNTLTQIITDLAEEGNCVIVGRGGQYVLREHADAFHLLLVANHEDRVRFMMETYNMTKDQAANTIRVHGKRRHNLYRKFGKEDYDDPLLYHLVLNMSKLSMQKATETAVKLVK
ncbi:MAG TPA: cytidylate kinase-like family protein [Desulfosalsimonadaceae bacterium]|nr:cytidylate kinase-like family protein [Desulfosalsimonadaceae bacterium]